MLIGPLPRRARLGSDCCGEQHREAETCRIDAQHVEAPIADCGLNFRDAVLESPVKRAPVYGGLSMSRRGNAGACGKDGTTREFGHERHTTQSIGLHFGVRSPQVLEACRHAGASIKRELTGYIAK